MRKRGRFQEALTASMLLAPAVTVLGLFGLFPLLYALVVSLHEWQYRRGAFVGLTNYRDVLGDPVFPGCLLLGVCLLLVSTMASKRGRMDIGPVRRGIPIAIAAFGLILAVRGIAGIAATGSYDFLNGLKVTAFYAAGTIPIQLLLSMLLAYLLYQKISGKGTFRLLFFLPYVTPMIATAVVFRSIFSPRPESIANRLLTMVGLETQHWLFESGSIVEVVLRALGINAAPSWIGTAFPSLAMVSIIVYNIWVFTGYNTVIYLASLTGIPKELTESAEIDGASRWKIFRHIIFPLLSPTTFFLSVVALIGTFKAFNHIYILRTPGAASTVDTASIVIFDKFYKEGNAGMACAMALLLFVVILVLTLAQNRYFGKKVFYR